MIKRAMEEITGDLKPSERVYNNVINELKGERKMKISFKKLGVCVAAAVVIGATCVGATQLAKYGYSHSSHKDYINHMPTEKEVEKAVDYSPKYPERLGDYTLVGAQPSINGISDENHNSISESRTIVFDYKNGDKKLSLFTEPERESMGYGSEPVKGAKDIDLYYSKTLNKFVPPDYKASEEELAQAEAGEINLAYGSQEVEIMYSEYVGWTEEGVSYGILAMGDEELIGEEKMIDFANTVITAE